MYRSHHVEGTRHVLCDLDPKVKVTGQNSVFSCKCIFSLTVRGNNFKLCTCIDHTEGSWPVLCDLDLKVKVTGQIIYFLVNVSPPKGLEVAASNFIAG